MNEGYSTNTECSRTSSDKCLTNNDAKVATLLFLYLFVHPDHRDQFMMSKDFSVFVPPRYLTVYEHFR